MHLLACLLARAWNGPEAISIWSEIIQTRKAVLQARTLESVRTSAATASLIDVDRDKLSEWDASARSVSADFAMLSLDSSYLNMYTVCGDWLTEYLKWLRTADRALRTQQTQLMLIIDNMNICIHQQENIYTEVMGVWKTSMTTLENLISGIPQSVKSAEGIMGLCSWHLYPNMCAVGITTTHVRQNDELVNGGGLLTIGLCKSPMEELNGVSWSLPLSHMYHYGKPVVAFGTVFSPRTSISFQQLLWITLGSVTATWDNRDADLNRFCEFLVAFGNLLGFRFHSLWPGISVKLAREYLDSPDSARLDIARYFMLGRRRYADFIAKASHHPAPCFGLSDPNYFIKLIEVEKRIDVLREMATSSGIQITAERSFIRYLHVTDSGHNITEIASLVPQRIQGVRENTHRRWVVLPEILTGSRRFHITAGIGITQWSIPFPQISTSDDWLSDDWFSEEDYAAQEDAVIRRSIEIIQHLGEPCGLLDEHTFIADKLNTPKLPKSPLSSDSADSQLIESFHWSSRPQPRHLRYLLRRKNEGFSDKKDEEDRSHRPWEQEISKAPVTNEEIASDNILLHWQLGHFPTALESKTYHFLFGDPSTATVFSADEEHSCISTEFVTQTILSNDAESFELGELLQPYIDTEFQKTSGLDYYKSFFVLLKAHQVYSTMPEAEISMALLSKPLVEAKWAKAFLGKKGAESERALSLACIALFDSGTIDLKPEYFDEVLAISSGNSLYASELLFCDPVVEPSAGALRHIHGNLGKSGVALLISPPELAVHEADLNTWELVNHNPFDGSLQDNFGSISLYLILTGYEQVIDSSRRGALDKDSFYVEAVVQAYDRGQWVADLDLLRPRRATLLPKEADKGNIDRALPAPHLHGGSSSVQDSIDPRKVFLSANIPDCIQTSEMPTLLVSSVEALEESSVDGSRDEENLCRHETRQKEDTSYLESLISIDNWYEYLDPPTNPGIIRARNNWVARLALSAVPLPKDWSLIIASDNVCWTCVHSAIRRPKTTQRTTREMTKSSLNKFFVLC